jgi:Domain of unknown function (DUF4136)
VDVIRGGKFVAAALGALLLLSGCETGKVTVLAEQAGAQIGRTYAWHPAAGLRQGSPQVDNDIIRGRIEGAIDRTLAAKGYTRVASPAEADLLVAYHVGVREKTDVRVDQTAPMGMACGHYRCGGWGWGYYGAPTTSVSTYTYHEGNLMIDFTDSHSDKLVWRAVNQGQVSSKTSEQQNIDKIVTKTLEALPPPRV